MISDKKRLGVAFYFIAGAEAIANRVFDDEVRSCWTHLRSTGSVVAPRSCSGADGVCLKTLRRIDRSCYLPSSPWPLLVVPLFKEDISIGGMLCELCQERLPTFIGMHQCRQNVIALNAEFVGDTFLCGNVLLHEAGHSLRAAEEGRLGLPDPPHMTLRQCREEGSLSYMTARIWKSMGGETYKALLEEVVARVELTLRGQWAYVRLPYNERWAAILGHLFGPAPNQVARLQRHAWLVRHASFEVIDRRCLKPAEDFRTEMLQVEYQQVPQHSS